MPKQIIEIKNRSVSQISEEDGIINAVKRMRFNENLSFISPDYIIGKGTRIYSFCNLFGQSKIGENCIISSYVEIQHGVLVGNNCRIGSFSFLCSGVEIGNNVFLGSHITTINDRRPTPHNKNYKQEKTIIKDGVSIGSGTVIMCGVTIGEQSMIGAGSLVLKDVPDGEIWAGHPVRQIGLNYSSK